MTDDRLVSVIIPTYYRNDLLEEAIDSVLRQEHPTEVIVVDDSGERHAERTVAEYPSVEYIPLGLNRGQNTALNRGLQSATGKYIQFLDDDDELLEGKLRKQVDVFEDNPEVDVVYCGKKYSSGRESLPSIDEKGDVLKRCLTFNLNCCVTSSMLIRKTLLDTIGPLPTPPGSTDTHMKILFSQVTDFEFVDEALILKREESSDSVSNSWNAIEGTWLVFDWYDSAYAQAGREVRESAKSAAAWREAKFLLENDFWSVRAIYRYWYALWTDPDPSIGKFAMPLLSVFGLPGKRVLEYGDELLQSN